jgi:uncharacterized repeat protein (TIGR01451 family)
MTFSKFSTTLILGLVLFAVTSTGFTQAAPQLELSISDTKVNLTEAERTGEAETSYTPGDTIHYTIIARNVGDAVMSEPVVTDPIPQGVIYIPNSARGEDSEILFSINKGLGFVPWPPTYSVQDKDGNPIQKEASPEMITDIRWVIQTSLEPNEQKILEFNVIVK